MKSERLFELSPRMSLIASKVLSGAVVADIGTDHAFIPIWLIKKGIIERAYLSDIKQGPILMAQNNALKYGVTDNMTFLVADGLQMAQKYSPDTVIIAGMGGEVIEKILEESQYSKRDNVLYILQPMTKITFLRKYLLENGFMICDEELCAEDKKLYIVMTAMRGNDTPYSEFELFFSRKLIEKKGPLLGQYSENKISQLVKIKSGLDISGKETQEGYRAYIDVLLKETIKFRKELG